MAARTSEKQKFIAWQSNDPFAGTDRFRKRALHLVVELCLSNPVAPDDVLIGCCAEGFECLVGRLYRWVGKGNAWNYNCVRFPKIRAFAVPVSQAVIHD